MFIFSFISSDSELRSVNHTSIYENSELVVLENIKFLGEISNDLSNDLLGTNVCRTFKSC